MPESLINGLLLFGILIGAVLFVGAWSVAMMTTFERLEEPPQPGQEPHPPPVVYLPMMDSSGESAAALAELYRQYYDREGA